MLDIATLDALCQGMIEDMTGRQLGPASHTSRMRAVCGKTACTVWRAGRRKPSRPLSQGLSLRAIVNTAAASKALMSFNRSLVIRSLATTLSLMKVLAWSQSR